jgi:hypothetical protein
LKALYTIATHTGRPVAACHPAESPNTMPNFWTARMLPLATLLVLMSGCASVGAIKDGLRSEPGPDSGEQRQRTARDRLGGFHVVIDLDVNELRFMDGKRVVWTGPVGTGTGLTLQGKDGEWEFSTPNGVFYVQRKEENPVWILPDWYFVKEGRAIPPENSPQRRVPGALGAAAVYLSDEIAIHGTDKPELLGQRVSHGCIRLSDPNAIRLYHNVQVGTPVVITGGKQLARMRPEDIARPTNPRPAPRQANPLTRLSTQQLLTRLDRQLADGDTSSAWIATTSELIRRGIADDAIALRGILARAGTSGTEKVDREYATFLADAFARGSMRAVVSLARIDATARDRAAMALVEAIMDLYPGDLNASAAPWPSGRVPNWQLGPEGTQGWRALRAAEELYRERPPGVRLVMENAAR